LNSKVTEEYRERIRELAILVEKTNDDTPDVNDYKIRLCREMARLYKLIEEEESK